MFLLIHHLTFPRDSYSDLISSQLPHHTLETSEKADSALTNLLVAALIIFSFLTFSVLFFSFFFKKKTGPQ